MLTNWVLLILITAILFPWASPTIFELHRVHPVPANDSVGMEVHLARDTARHARMFGASSSGTGAAHFGVWSAGYVGLYYTKVRLGTPPRDYSVQIDTGSYLLWVACSSCSTCPPSSFLVDELKFFDIGNSTTAELLSCSHPMCPASSHCQHKTEECDYTVHYNGNSDTSGSYVSDIIHFDMTLEHSVTIESSASVVFGCSTYKSGNLAKPYIALDGIFGFGQQRSSVVSQLASMGIIPWAFAHCLRRDGGGILVLGEVLEPSFIYTPLVLSQSLLHYDVNLQSISIKGHPLPIDQAVFGTSPDGGAFIDSGTTLVYLPEEAYDPFISAINSTVSQSAKPILFGGNPCYSVTTSLSDVFPPFSLNFEGDASMVLRPEEYLMYTGIIDGLAMWCMGFQKSQGQRLTILGDLIMKDKIVVYDLARKRIGWANYNCSSSVNVSVTLPNTEQRSCSSSDKSLLLEAIFAQILVFISLLMHFAAHNEP